MESFFSRSFGAAVLQNIQNLPTGNGTRTRIIEYTSDKNTIRALIEMPNRNVPAGGWPVIVVAHGYIPPAQYTTKGSYRLVTGYYARGGFLVIKPDYRGHGKSEGALDKENRRRFYRTQLYSIDVMNLIAALDKIPEADTNNVFLYGHSMGGDIALRIIESVESVLPIKIKAASLWAAVARPFPENNLYFLRKHDPSGAESNLHLIERELESYNIADFSPMTHLDRIKIPLYVHHGTDDESVPFEWSVTLIEKLGEAGVDATFLRYEGENHNISKSFYSVLDRDMEFFKKFI
jgi:dipeptidyl aminopeptidase/acylaminoacyl peptidase